MRIFVSHHHVLLFCHSVLVLVTVFWKLQSIHLFILSLKCLLHYFKTEKNSFWQNMTFGRLWTEFEGNSSKHSVIFQKMFSRKTVHSKICQKHGGHFASHLNFSAKRWLKAENNSVFLPHGSQKLYHENLTWFTLQFSNDSRLKSQLIHT